MRVAVGRVACVHVLVCPALQRLCGSDFHPAASSRCFQYWLWFRFISLFFCLQFLVFPAPSVVCLRPDVRPPSGPLKPSSQCAWVLPHVIHGSVSNELMLLIV